MRQIEKNMVQAVKAGRNFRSNNTVVTVDGSGIKVYLHGNCIYTIFQGVARFTLAGWNTVTTRSRLNALGVDVRQKNWTPIYNGIEISTYNWYTI